MAATPERIVSLARRMVAAVEARDAEGFAACFAPDAVSHHPLEPEPLRGREAIRASEEALYASFSDVRVEVRSLVADDRRCALEVVLTARNTGPIDLGGEEPLPPTGRGIALPATWWIDVGEDGLVVESRDYFDTAVLMAQLGLADEG